MITQSCTVFCEDFSEEIPAQQVPDLIFSIFPEEIKHEIKIKSYPAFDKLFDLLNQKNSYYIKLEKQHISDFHSPHLQCCSRNNKNYYISKILELENLIDSELKTCNSKNAGYCFIYCASASTAYKILDLKNDLSLKPAPSDTDIIWSHLKHHKGLSLFKRILINLLFVILFFIIFTPLAMSSLISDILSELSLNLSFFSKSLSSLVLSLTQYMVIPYFIKILAGQEQHYLKSEASSSRIFKYLGYSIVNIIVFPLIGTVTLTVFIQKIIEIELTKWNADIVSNIQKIGDFFVNFIISTTFVSNALDLLSFSSYFAVKISEWQAQAFYTEKKPSVPDFDFPHEYSKVLTSFAVILVFSVSTPLILPFGAVYMLIKHSVDKYNLLFAYSSSTETVTNQKTITTSLFLISSLFQLVNSGIFVVNGTSVLIWLAGILSALSLITLAFSVAVYKYWHLAQTVNLNKFWNLSCDFEGKYRHPCESLVNL